MIRPTINRYRSAYSGLPREVWLLALVLFVNRCGTMVLPFLTLYLTNKLSMSEGAAGAMISVYGLGAICGAYFGGRLTESFGAIRLQTVSLFVSVVPLLLMPVWTSRPLIAVTLFCWSVAVEAVRPANATAITKFTTTENRTRAFALQRLAANLGFSFGPAVGGVLATFHFTLLFVVDAFTTLLAASVLLYFFRMRRVENAADNAQTAPVRVSPWNDRTFVAYLMLMLIMSLVFIQFMSTYPMYLRDHFHFSKPLIGMMFAVNTAVIVVFEMVLVDYVRPLPIVRTIGWGCFLSCLGFGMLPFGTSLSYCVLAMLVLTMGEMLSWPLSSGFVANRSPQGSEGVYMGWYLVMHSVAWVLGPAIGSAIYEINPDTVWIVSLFVGVGLLVGFQLLSSRTQVEVYDTP